MRRFYSHYTFIYPYIYLKNHVVGLNLEGEILEFFPFEHEIENTEFYSGILFFVPKKSIFVNDQIRSLKNKFEDADLEAITVTIEKINSVFFQVIDENGNCIQK